MSERSRYRTEALAAIHESMKALYEINAVSKDLMLEFDSLLDGVFEKCVN